MAGSTHLDVRVWNVSQYKGTRKVTYRVRWRVHDKTFGDTFSSKKLADSFRSGLLVAIRNGEAFDGRTGFPASMSSSTSYLTWLDHATAFVDMKWPHASPRHRKGIAEGLTTATVAVLPPGGPDPATVRAALHQWLFNSATRKATEDQEPPEHFSGALDWLERRSPTPDEVTQPALLRQLLDGLALTLKGDAASASTIARKRSAVYSAFQYAVELGALPANPIDRITWKPPAHTDVVDRGVVVNPDQARALLGSVGEIYPSLEAFFGCIYYAAMRPSEVRHLFVSNLDLPDSSTGWGTLHLLGSTQTAGGTWTDSGTATEDRQLKHRARRASRDVPAPPELVTLLKSHMDRFPPGVGGRLFVTRTGRAGVPVPPPYASPSRWASFIASGTSRAGPR